MAEVPPGTVTFLFTDIEDSTMLWERHPEVMHTALMHHHAILQEVVAAHGGVVFQIVGDAFCVAFADPNQAVKAAVAVQRGLLAQVWGETGPLRVRMGIHTGLAEVEAGEYLSNPTLNRVARVLAAGHGGQVLLSGATTGLVRSHAPPGTAFRDLGMHSLKGFAQPEQLYQVVAPGLPADFPPLKTKQAARHNLPEGQEPFFGRQREIADLLAQFEQPARRLVTIFGPGGMGKTCLAIEAAARLVEVFPQGVWFVPLAPLSAPELIPPAVLEALRLPAAGQSDPQDWLVEYLRDKELLLVLDNYEHLLPDAARWAADLLRAVPQVKLLVTSRARLNIQSEWVYPLEGLDFPVQGAVEIGRGTELEAYAAPALFLEQARRVAGFSLPESEKSCVLHICRLVHGMPLALVLAASWVRLLSCPEIAKELESSLDSLAADQPDLPERQRSIQAVFDYSWQTLSSEQQAVLSRLAVFRGGFDRAAAAGVAGATLPVLAALSDRSLIQKDAAGRYAIHELLRRFAGTRPAETGEVERLRTRHLDYFVQLAEQAQPELIRRNQKHWLDRLEIELDNLRAALEWSLISSEPPDAETGVRLAIALDRFWSVRGHWREVRRWLHDQLERAGAAIPPALSIQAQIVYSNVTLLLGDIDAAREMIEACLEASRALGDLQLYAKALFIRGEVAGPQGEEEKVKQCAEESLRLAQQVNDLWLVAAANTLLGRHSVSVGDFLAAHRFYEASLTVSRAAGNIQGEGVALWALADLLGEEGDKGGELTAYKEAQAIFQELNDRRGLVWAEIALAYFHLEEGRFDEASLNTERALVMAGEIAETFGEIVALLTKACIALLRGEAQSAREFAGQSLARNRLFQERHLTSMALSILGGVAQAEGRPERAARLFGMAGKDPEFSVFAVKSHLDQADSAVQAALGKAAFARLYAEGRADAAALTPEALIQMLLESEFLATSVICANEIQGR